MVTMNSCSLGRIRPSSSRARSSMAEGSLRKRLAWSARRRFSRRICSIESARLVRSPRILALWISPRSPATAFARRTAIVSPMKAAATRRLIGVGASLEGTFWAPFRLAGLRGSLPWPIRSRRLADDARGLGPCEDRGVPSGFRSMQVLVSVGKSAEIRIYRGQVCCSRLLLCGREASYWSINGLDPVLEGNSRG